MTTDLEIAKRTKDNPPGKRGIRRVEVWESEVDAVIPPGWVNPDRPGERTVISAQVCKAVTKSWRERENTPDGFVEHHQRVPCRPMRRLKLVTLDAANEVTGVDYVHASGYSMDDFYAVIEALFIGDGEPLSDYW